MSRGRGNIRRGREELVVHFPHSQSSDGPQSAIRLGDMKLFSYSETGEAKRIDLSHDLGEQTDLAATRPDVAAELRNRLGAHPAAVNAKLPAGMEQPPGTKTKPGATR